MEVTRSISNAGFEAALFEEESLNQSGHSAEKVAYLAIYSPLGYGIFDGIDEPISYRLYQTTLEHSAKTIGSHRYFCRKTNPWMMNRSM
ncbi:MAG: hypothetical protein OXE99_12085 [Cellvibrionales bacterium]|nr:hypothetical protein [Cellvibrionales bacterium]